MRFIAQYPSQMSITNIKTADNSAVCKLVDNILDAKRTDPDADASELENEIDQVVYSWYN